MEEGEKIKINIGNKPFTVEIAYTDEQKEKGLSNRESLDENSGMLFIWDEPEEVSIWMKNTLIPLDIVFINEELEVVKVYQGVPNSEELFTENNIVFVLEVNVNSGIKEGDELEFSPEKKSKLSVLNENGQVQGTLQGGERIFSRIHTKMLIKFAKKANATNKDNDYKALGKRVFKFLDIQDNTDPQYVDNDK